MHIRPEPIRTNDNDFAHRTLRVRLPAILREVMALNADLPAEALDQLHLLAVGMENDAPIPMIHYPAVDYADWRGAYLAHDGDTWLNTEWYFAETFFYRHLVELFDWFRRGRDPFAPHKRAEYDAAPLWTQLGIALDIREQDMPFADKLAAMLALDLWGNSFDLSVTRSSGVNIGGSRDPLLVDRTAQIVTHLMTYTAPYQLDVLLDNGGAELAVDLALVDLLLDDGAFSVVLHVKQHPTFVSDVTHGDVLDCLGVLRERKHPLERALGDRLSAAVQEGAITIRPDWFWNSSHFMWEKRDLARLFEGSHLLISKGDVNYRRFIGDAIWDVTTPFSQALDYMPVPVAALRTLKSDSLLGLAPGTAEHLDATVPGWRNDGKHGLIDFRA